jgi:hypothetical protein
MQPNCRSALRFPTLPAFCAIWPTGRGVLPVWRLSVSESLRSAGVCRQPLVEKNERRDFRPGNCELFKFYGAAKRT